MVPLPRIIGLIPAALGYKETRQLRQAHRSVVRALRHSAEPAAARPAWLRYQELAEAMINTIPNEPRALFARAQIGLIIAKAGIWYEAGVTARYLEELEDAFTYADNMGFVETATLLKLQLTFASRDISYLLSDQARAYELELGDYFQNRRLFDYATEAYVEYEQSPSLTDRQRGMVNLRLAESYDALLKAEPADTALLLDLLDGSLQSALLYLEGEPEQATALTLLDQFTLLLQ